MNTPPQLPCAMPDIPLIPGRLVDLELVDAGRHAAGLWEAIGSKDEYWSLITPGPFETLAAFTAWLADRAGRADGGLYAIVDKASRRALGQFHLIGVNPAMGTTEMGLVYGTELRRQRAGTEAFYLLANYVLGDLRYRRFEWRCGPEHTASRRAALRYGFTLEGVARQTMWAKGHSWDTAVYSILDHEWPVARARLEAWLRPENFDAEGRQLSALNPASSA